MNNKIVHIKEELLEHLPFAIFAACLGLILVSMMGSNIYNKAHEIFHVFHPIHLLFSVIATTAMFYKHERKALKAIVVGVLGSVLICSASDIVFPYLSGKLFGANMEFHLCILEHPIAMMPFIVVGVLMGILVSTSVHKSTIFSHFSHVLLSTFASLLYLISNGLSDWSHNIGGTFAIVLIAVVVPCCISDILFPLCLLKDDCKYCHIDKNNN